jgi:hypothetical protein
MTPDAARFDRAIHLFDTTNAEDPNKVVVDGIEYPSELLYAQRMTLWQQRLYPDASEPLRLAARAQHIRRWEIPRDSFPMDRAGYHRWRTTLYTFHADVAEKILHQAGYDDETVRRVRSLLRKERLKTDPDVQALEDIICLVFLENYFAQFARQHDDDKVVTILQRTWAKMSPVGHQAALGLSMPDDARRLVERALGST